MIIIIIIFNYHNNKHGINFLVKDENDEDDPSFCGNYIVEGDEVWQLDQPIFKNKKKFKKHNFKFSDRVWREDCRLY